ncbi:MAG: cation diffusion facilitator family transporter [Candidatus Gracilibacteria bacterium]|nr:cation diffusion facilitator family transporter [Candidatus Gracilibacteria bacterium]
MQKIKKAIILANFTAIFLVIIKVITGILTGSLAVLSSALDSLLDFGVSLFNLYIFKRSGTKQDEYYNYGHGKIQGIGAVLEGLIVGFSGVALIYFSIEKILSQKGIEKVNISIYMMIVSVIITGFLVYYLSNVAKENNNLTIRADMLHYKTDLRTNLGIIFSLILIKITGFEILDAVISIMIGFYILFSSKSIILEGFHMLMDRKIDDELIKKIIKIISIADNRITGYHFLKTRKSGDDVFIDFHLVFNKDIKLLDAHTVGDKIEFEIIKIIPNSIISIHLDPFDDSNKDYCKV